MTRDEAKRALEAANASIATAVLLIRNEQATIEAFFREERDMDNFGHIVDPTLFKDPERRAVAALLNPIYRAALDLLRAYDSQVEAGKAALTKVAP